MHPQFLEMLCSPDTGEELHLESSDTRSNGMVMSGTLVCRSGLRYPIVRGIPRFGGTEGNYTSSFGYEWNRWPRVQFESENAGRPMAGHTTTMWEVICEKQNADLHGETIVEFGCGSGRFLDVVRRKGGLVVGIESSQAAEAARLNFADDPDVLIVQGDLLRPPFREAVFGGGFAIGVLHHTPKPARGLKSLARCIQQGGWVACCVYPRGEFYDYRSVARFRWLNNRLKPVFGYRPALAYAYLSAGVLSPVSRLGKRIPGLSRVLGYLERNWLVWLNLPDVRWRVLDVFDAITPAIASTHSNEEVVGWMVEAGCKDVRTTRWCQTSVVGVKEQRAFL